MTSLPDAAPATPATCSSSSSGRTGEAGDVDITKPLLIEETAPGNTTTSTKPAPIIVQDSPQDSSTSSTPLPHTTITMGTFTFCPLKGFYDAIEDAQFDQDRFLDVLTTIIGCDLVYSDELQECCVDQHLPSLALAAATCPYVLGCDTRGGTSSGEPYIEIALGLVGDVEHCSRHAHKTRLYTTLINPVPAAILVAAVQPDVDPALFWQQLERAYFDNGEQQPLNEQQVLEILTSDAVKLSHRPLWKRVGDFFTASLF